MQTKRGFTLIEVLIALVILAIALTAVIKATSGVARNAVYLQDKTAAQWVALNVYNQYALGLLTISPTLETTQSSTTMFQKNWHWNALFSPTQNDTVINIQVQVRANVGQKPIATILGQISLHNDK